MRRSGFPSARSRRRRLRSRSWARSLRGCGSPRRASDEVRGAAATRSRRRDRGPFDPQGRHGAQEGHADRQGRGRGAGSREGVRDRGGAARAGRCVGGCRGGGDRGGGCGRGRARGPRVHGPRQPVRRTGRCAGRRQGAYRRAQRCRSVDHVCDARCLCAGRRRQDDRDGEDHSVRGRGCGARQGARGRARRSADRARRAVQGAQGRDHLDVAAGARRQGDREDPEGDRRSGLRPQAR